MRIGDKLKTLEKLKQREEDYNKFLQEDIHKRTGKYKKKLEYVCFPIIKELRKLKK